MQIKIFNIPVFGDNAIEDEVNRFLRGHRILQVERHFCPDNGGYWAIFIEYADYAPDSAPANRREKVDVLKDLSDNERERFEHYRQIRKEIAQRNNVAAYMVFTDAELAKLCKIENLDAETVLGIKGIAPSRLESYVKFFFTGSNETGG